MAFDGWPARRSAAVEGRATSDPDIFRAAKLLIDQHEDGALVRAGERVDELLETGDIEGAVIWRRIVKALEELRRGRREGEAVN